jgi:hypothetical protein
MRSPLMVQRGRYGVTGYPTLKVFREGKASEFTGPREYRGIVEHMRKLTKPVAKVLASQKDAQEISLNAPYKLAAVSIVRTNAGVCGGSKSCRHHSFLGGYGCAAAFGPWFHRSVLFVRFA